MKRALRAFTNGKKLNLDDWGAININETDLPTYGREICLCTHEINHLHYLKYMPTGEICLLGSDCIQRFGPEEMYLEAIGKLCVGCKKNKIDSRTISGRDLFCTIECKEKYEKLKKYEEFKTVCD